VGASSKEKVHMNDKTTAEVLAFAEKAEHFREERKRLRKNQYERKKTKKRP